MVVKKLYRFWRGLNNGYKILSKVLNYITPTKRYHLLSPHMTPGISVERDISRNGTA